MKDTIKFNIIVNSRTGSISQLISAGVLTESALPDTTTLPLVVSGGLLVLCIVVLMVPGFLNRPYDIVRLVAQGRLDELVRRINSQRSWADQVLEDVIDLRRRFDDVKCLTDTASQLDYTNRFSEILEALAPVARFLAGQPTFRESLTEDHYRNISALAEQNEAILVEIQAALDEVNQNLCTLEAMFDEQTALDVEEPQFTVQEAPQTSLPEQISEEAASTETSPSLLDSIYNTFNFGFPGILVAAIASFALPVIIATYPTWISWLKFAFYKFFK